MCDLTGVNYIDPNELKPERRISNIINEEARVYIDPAVIRLIVKYRWKELARAAHEIHGS